MKSCAPTQPNSVQGLVGQNSNALSLDKIHGMPYFEDFYPGINNNPEVKLNKLMVNAG
jgi:hypothetical protein